MKSKNNFLNIKKNKVGYIYAFFCIFAWSFIPVISRFGQITLDFYQLILGSWVLDSTYYTSPYGDQTESYCGQLGYYGDTGLIFTFDNNGDLFVNEMDVGYCGMDLVSISNNDYYYNNPSFFDSYSINQNNLNLGFMQFEIVNLA